MLLVVEQCRGTGQRRPILEAGLVAGPGQVEVPAAGEVHAGGATVVQQLDAARSEHGLVQEAGVVEWRRVRELRAQVQRRQALGLAEARPVLAVTAGDRRLLAHAEVARVALQRRARRATDVPAPRSKVRFSLTGACPCPEHSAFSCTAHL
jgi:hypothetical protein